jgi:hypothetical protein
MCYHFYNSYGRFGRVQFGRTEAWISCTTPRQCGTWFLFLPYGDDVQGTVHDHDPESDDLEEVNPEVPELTFTSNDARIRNWTPGKAALGVNATRIFMCFVGQTLRYGFQYSFDIQVSNYVKLPRIGHVIDFWHHCVR